MKTLTHEGIKAQFAQVASVQRQALSIEGFSHAGVLVPLLSSRNGLELLFTKRTESVETHKGQISFPGGMVDASDEDIIHTALREAHEEVGLPRSCVDIVGILDDMTTPTGFVITPVVGIIDPLPLLFPNKDEVAAVFHVELDFFAQPSNGRKELREFRGRKHEVWFYDCGEHLIWGATATIVRSLLKKLQMI